MRRANLTVPEKRKMQREGYKFFCEHHKTANCAIDENIGLTCVHAPNHKTREGCRYWKPVHIERRDELIRLHAELAAERDRNGIITQAAQEVTNALRAENESLRKENWEHIARGYALINMLPDETLVGDIQTARRNIGGVVDSLRAENERLREALIRIDGMATTICMKDDAGYGIRAESVMPIYETARAALEGVTKKEETGNE